MAGDERDQAQKQVDDMERRVFEGESEQRRGDAADGTEDRPAEPAFEIDLDPEQQGSTEAAAEDPG